MITTIATIACTILFVYTTNKELKNNVYTNGTSWDVVLKNLFHYMWIPLVIGLVEAVVFMIFGASIINNTLSATNNIVEAVVETTTQYTAEQYNYYAG